MKWHPLPPPTQLMKQGYSTRPVAWNRGTPYGLITLAYSGTGTGDRKRMGCMRLYRMFHITQGPGPHCFLLCWSRSRCWVQSRSKPVWLDHYPLLMNRGTHYPHVWWNRVPLPTPLRWNRDALVWWNRVPPIPLWIKQECLCLMMQGIPYSSTWMKFPLFDETGYPLPSWMEQEHLPPVD